MYTQYIKFMRGSISCQGIPSLAFLVQFSLVYKNTKMKYFVYILHLHMHYIIYSCNQMKVKI